ncbi:hypothetical protein Hanom_Chr16g01515421 [Helianthus anomalus]
MEKSKLHEWSLWFTKVLDLVPSFPKVHGWPLSFALLNTSANRSKGFSMSKLKAKCVTKWKPHGSSMYFWKNLATKCVTTQGPSMYFCKARDQIQNFGKPQGPSLYFMEKWRKNPMDLR